MMNDTPAITGNVVIDASLLRVKILKGGFTMLTENSRIKDILTHPIGKDILKKILLQVGKNVNIVSNPIVANMKLKSLPKLLGGIDGQGFINSVLEILNGEPDVPRSGNGPIKPAWWKEAVFYQIYPRSFKDSNGDGIGDLGGIIEKLDYLKDIGVDAIWLCPVYDSPNDDNGYDIRDYRKIMAEFGTMDDFDRLLEAVHARDMKLIMDLVINHTSDEHEWFQKAIKEPDSKYADFYFFRDEPNNWTSFFGGSAWKYIEERNQYALHLFSLKQMDLNWENPELRKEIIDMVRWWLEKGVDGFRMDVINYISKRPGLPDGNPMIGMMMGFYGIEHYFYGPKLHQYLRELKSEAFAPYNAFSVGETPGIGMEMSKLLTADYRNELDMIFSFDHLENPGKGKFDDYLYDLNYYKEYMIDWMENYGNASQMSLFYENHDNPRMVSKVDPDPKYRTVLAKLLAVMQLTLRGTPFIYQGQELGMTNKKFTSMDEIRDIESKNMYSEWKNTMGETGAFSKILVGSRDNARTPMQWSAGKYAGFSEAEPWIWAEADDDYKVCNVEDQLKDEDSVLNFYRKMIRIRKEHPALIYGDIEIINKKTTDLFTYYRKNGNETLFIECNLGRNTIRRPGSVPAASRLISNYPDTDSHYLRPYEATVWQYKG